VLILTEIKPFSHPCLIYQTDYSYARHLNLRRARYRLVNALSTGKALANFSFLLNCLPSLIEKSMGFYKSILDTKKMSESRRAFTHLLQDRSLIYSLKKSQLVKSGGLGGALLLPASVVENSYAPISRSLIKA
jgi:hypothetical protein